MLEIQKLGEIVQNIWASMVGAEVVFVGQPPSSDGGTPQDGHGSYVGVVRISGAWSGALTIEFTPEGASNLAGALLGLLPDEITDDVVRDTIGEMANIMGGNMKALVPGPSSLSLPVVVERESAEANLAGADLLHRIFATSGGHPFAVSLYTWAGPV